MAGTNLTSPSMPFADAAFSGGLNSTSGPLGLNNSEASDIQNIDFNKFGSIIKRNGYATLNSSAITNDPDIDGLHWYEYESSGSIVRKAINVSDGKFWKMDDLDGTWDDITGGLTITSGNHCDFENWNNKVYVTNGEDPPFEWDGTTAQAIQNPPTGLTDAKFVTQFNNHLILLNVVVSATVRKSRIYWSDIRADDSWQDTNWIEVALDDGTEITGAKVLSDRLVIFKNRSVYNLFFTGSSDVPFTLQKSNSPVGCIAPFSIQEVNNGLVFLSYDGVYYYDGNNAHKVSDKITTTIEGMNTTVLSEGKSLVQKEKNRYWLSLPSAGQTENDRVLIWDYFNNAWSIYVGMAPSAMATFYVSGIEERPYFGDYAGFVYRADTGANDNPLGVETAIEAFYQTNWRPYADLVHQKSTPHIYVYYQHSSSILSLSWTYDFEDGDGFSQTMDLSTSADTYGTGEYDTATYAGEGGAVKRRDLTGRGRVFRMKFSNATLDETFQIDGLGSLAYAETEV